MLPNEKTPEAKAPGEEKVLPVAIENEEAEAPEVGVDDEAPEDVEPEAPETDEDGEPDDETGEKPALTKSARERAKQKAKIAAAEEAAKRAVAERDAAQAALARFTDDIGPAPKPEDFADHDEFVAELAAYRAEARAAARQKKAVESSAASASESAGKSRIDLFSERAMALKESHPGIETKIFDQSSLPIPPVLANILMESERGPEVAYYLTGNPAEMQRIFAMTPAAAAMAFGRIEATLTAPKPRTVTQAPPPARTLSGGSSRVAKNPANMSPAEYRAWRANGGGD